MVLGVVGTFASGKDTVAEYLASLGFQHISTANVIRTEMVAQGLPLDRDTMTRFATETRQKHGNAYFTEQVITHITGNVVLADMRHPDEIAALREQFGREFVLIAVDAPIAIRFERARGRGRIGDGETLEDFRFKEERELSGKLGSHRLGDVIQMADIQIENSGSLSELEVKIDAVLSQLS